MKLLSDGSDLWQCWQIHASSVIGHPATRICCEASGPLFDPHKTADLIAIDSSDALRCSSQSEVGVGAEIAAYTKANGSAGGEVECVAV